jgi:NAD(P)-dependent dehydrogenase (short-subunit alcohol dehydrogenase family)
MGLLEGKVAVVTGGGTGIGRAVSLGLAAAGARVVVNDYGVSVDGMDPSSEPANHVVAEITKAGGQAVAAPDSVATMAGGRAVVDLALSRFGDLHVLVCCAGILRERMIFNMSEEEWDAVIAVHLKGHFTVMQPATRHMRERKAGSIITFTSTAGLEGSPGQPNYSAAKEGIVGLTRSTALAMAKYGVRCNAISPTADTRMTQRLPGERRGAATATPPEAIAPVATFLASDRARHITGQVYTVVGPKIAVWNQPAEVRAVYAEARWTPEEIAARIDSTIGQERMSLIDRLEQLRQAAASGDTPNA